MKKALIFSLFLFGIMSVNTAQTKTKTSPCNSGDTRLNSKFDSDEISKMADTEICNHLFILDNGYVIMDIPSEKASTIIFDGTHTIADLNAINLYDLDIEIKEDQYQYFKLSGTNKMLAIKPMFLINSERSKK